jgi:hypothetical protein
MTQSMLRLKNKVSFRDMEGFVETGSQNEAGRILVDLHGDKYHLEVGSTLVLNSTVATLQ